MPFLGPAAVKLAIVTGLMAVSACFGPINTVALKPTPNVAAKRHFSGKVDIDVAGVPQTRLCAQTSGLRDICVDGFRASIMDGLDNVLHEYFRPGPETFNAKFKLVEFSHAPAAVTSTGTAVAVSVMMRWKFELTAPDGTVIVAVGETTHGPKPLANEYDTPNVVRDLINAALERVGDNLNEIQVSEKPAKPSKDDDS
jgi:hypothetical protein